MRSREARRVSVLKAESIEEITKLPDVVTTPFNLRYLDLSYTKLEVVPKALCKLTQLQMLNLLGTRVVELPPEIKKLTKLRRLQTLVWHDNDQRIFDCFQGAKVYSGICLLKDMQVLGYVEANKDLVMNLCNLTLLRRLEITKVRRKHIKELWTSITRLAHLSNLDIISHAKEEVLDLENLDPLPNLELFYLRGKLQGGLIPAIFSDFRKLRELRMGWSRLQADPIPSFAHMSHLVQLYLYRVYEGQIMTFSAGWFPMLEKLYLADMEQLSCMEVEAGTMPILNYMELTGLRSMLIVPAGFQNLTSLQQMVLKDMPVEFRTMVQGQDCGLPKKAFAPLYKTAVSPNIYP
uniref:Disease resistance protein RPM1 n=1 Tax=Aegilops tauschii TaxID=37682 RepID=R7VZ57_AEGTA